MKEKELEKLKSVYFRVTSLRTGIPTKYYTLPPEVIELYEQGKREAYLREEYKRKYRANCGTPENDIDIGFFPGQICPQLGRKAVGNHTLYDDDNHNIDY